MNEKLEKALDNVEITYSEVVTVANDMVKDLFMPINELVDRVSYSINNLSIDQIRDYILRLQLNAYQIAEIKEKSAMKAELAEALQKEKYAVSFNKLEGSAAVKDKLALVETAEETVTETLYNLVANLFKTKLDQLHRLVDALKSVLVSRMQENKFMQTTVVGDKDEKTYLAE